MESCEYIDQFNYYFLIGGLFLFYLVYRIVHSLLSCNNLLRTKYLARGHTWRSIQCNKSIPYNIYCNVCGKLMLPLMGLFCECCAISACKKCYRINDKKIHCKEISWPADKPFHHLWVNVGTFSRDNTHNTEGVENLKKYFCSWCQRTRLSSENYSHDTEVCDFQKYRNIIIPPTSVQVDKGKNILIKELQRNDWEPLIIFANRKSGSNRCDEVLSIFSGLLNPLQIIDIGSVPPEKVMQWLPSRCRVLVAGGDGTVAWVLNALHASGRVKASVGILPMGTGNDLARALGWGSSCSSNLDAHSIINSLKQAKEQLLDRWKITIQPKRRGLGRLRGSRTLFAHNYASVGVDAQVALDFHHARAQFLYRYANQTLNYVAYALLGVGRALDAGRCDALERRLRVWVGDVRGAGTEAGAAAEADAGAKAGAEANLVALALPPLQALVFLNIPSWGAGVDLWSLGSEEDVGKQNMDDGKLEVVGISSSIHIARLQCGLAEPFRFTQTSYVKIELDGSCAMQVDGEPWMQGPATILVERAGQSCLLRPSSLPNE